jgi:hypothetical protein
MVETPAATPTWQPVQLAARLSVAKAAIANALTKVANVIFLEILEPENRRAGAVRTVLQMLAIAVTPTQFVAQRPAPTHRGERPVMSRKFANANRRALSSKRHLERGSF